MTRAVLQFKTFPMTIMLTHGMRAIAQPGARNKAAYFVPLVVLTTAMAGPVLQARAVLSGKQPLPMDPTTEEGRAFWGAAMVAGGGLGLLGDFLFTGISGTNRFGSGPLISLLGPNAGMLGDALTIGFESLQGDTSAKQVADFVQRHLVPGGNLWYARLVLDRMIFDNVRYLSDPAQARRSALGKERYARQQGTGFWWAPNESLPEFLQGR